MKVVTIIQARTTSSRLPNKVLIDVYGKPLLERVIDQANKIRNTDEVWVATSTHENDDLIEEMCERKKTPCHRGSLEDVRGRFDYIAKKRKADILVRITADNPLTEPLYAEELIDFLKNNIDNYDYVRMDKTTVLDGTNCEVFTKKSLDESIRLHDDDWNREHVTPAICNTMKISELVSDDQGLVAKKPYFVGIDTFLDLKRSVKLFKTFGEKETLKQIIKEKNGYKESV